MTDITDQDRRLALRWCDMLGDSTHHEEAAATRRIILATVEAPAPSLAEELRSWAEDASYDEDRDNLLHAAARAEQMEHGIAEARAEVEQAEDRAAEWQGIAQRHYAHVELFSADVERLKRDLDEAYKTRDARDDEVDSLRAGVERLTAERLDCNPETKARVEAALNNLDKVETVTVQKGAESNAETTDPADVNPGEAWVVECRGERRNAVKDNDDNNVPWNTVNADGWCLPEDNEDVTLLHRLVPAPRVITNPDDLERAKRNTIIRDNFGVVCERAPLSDGWFTTGHGTYQTPYIELPATVLWEPEA